MKKIVCLAVGPSLLACAVSAHAQDALGNEQKVADSASIEEIVVTARFRAERLEDVGESITAVSGDAINTGNVTSLNDLASVVPGLGTADRGPSRELPELRGVGRAVYLSDEVPSYPLTGIYVNDVPISTPATNSRDVNLFDIQRVEVLRGPQGTLYGEGSMAGAIKYIYNDPGLSRTSARAQVTASNTDGSDAINYRTDGMINLPLVADTLGLRLVGFYDKDRGFIDRVFGGVREDDVNDARRYGGRAVLRFQSGQLTADLTTSYDLLKAGAAWVVGYGQPPGLVNSVRNAPDRRDDKFQLHSANIAYKVDGVGELRSITGYMKRDYFALYTDVIRSAQLTASFVPLAALNPSFSAYAADAINPQIVNDKQITQEFRFVSDFKGPIQLTAGAYYKRYENDTTATLLARGANDSLVTLPIYNYLVPPFLNAPPFGPTNPPQPNPAFGAPLRDANGNVIYVPYADNDFQTVGNQYAVFGEMSYQFTDALTVRAGLRYYRENLDRVINSRLAILTTPEILLSRQPTRDTLTNRVSEFLPRFSLEYKITPDNLTYISAARGARNGGFNSPVVTQDAAIVQGAVRPLFKVNDVLTFGPDSLWTYEIGTKNRSKDRRISFDAAFFYTDWRNVQSRAAAPTQSFNLFVNSGDARVYGVDYELALRLDDHWTLTTGGELVNAKTKDDFVFQAGLQGFVDPTGRFPANRPAIVTPAGTDLPFVRQSQILGGINYDREVGGNWRINSGANITWVSGTTNDLAPPAYYTQAGGTPIPGFTGKLKGYETLNAQITLTRNGSFAITLFGNNLTNAVEVQAVSDKSTEAFINRPRTIGLKLSTGF